MLAPSSVLNVTRTSRRPKPSPPIRSQSAPAPTVVPVSRSPVNVPPVMLATPRVPNGPVPMSSTWKDMRDSSSGVKVGIVFSLPGVVFQTRSSEVRVETRGLGSDGSPRWLVVRRRAGRRAETAMARSRRGPWGGPSCLASRSLSPVPGGGSQMRIVESVLAGRLNAQAAVDRQAGTGDELRCVGGQEDDGVGYVVDFAQAAERRR